MAHGGHAEPPVLVGARIGDGVTVTRRKTDKLHNTTEAFGVGRRTIGVMGHVEEPDRSSETIACALAEFSEIDLLLTNVGVNLTFGSLLDLAAGVAFLSSANASWITDVLDGGLTLGGGV